MVERLGETVSFYKIGLELLATGGMGLAGALKSQGKQVFLDWKLHDIGATVERSARVLAGAGCDLLTVHAEPQVMRAAGRAAAAVSLDVQLLDPVAQLPEGQAQRLGENARGDATGRNGVDPHVLRGVGQRVGDRDRHAAERQQCAVDDPDALAGTSIIIEYWPYGLETCGASAEELLGLLEKGSISRTTVLTSPRRTLGGGVRPNSRLIAAGGMAGIRRSVKR